MRNIENKKAWRKTPEQREKSRIRHAKYIKTDKYKAWKKKYDLEYSSRPETKEKIKAQHLKRKFGITLEDYQQMFDKQSGLCAICGRPNSINKLLAVDHNHKTGKIRALLCHGCNLAIGHAREDEGILIKMIEYLKQHR